MSVPQRFLGSIAGGALLGAAALAAPAGAAAPSPAARTAKSTITMSGSTSVAPLATRLAKKYVRVNRSVRFRLLQGGSDIGIADVARGRVTIGNSSRDPQSSDPGGLAFNKIARDGVCVATHKRNRIRNLSQSQVQAIFSGRVRNWKDVPGSTVSGAIDLVVRTAASGTQDAFQNIFMGQRLRVAGSAQTVSSNGRQAQRVRSNPNAIAYVDFDFTAGTNVVAYKGVACNLRTAKSGQYPGLRNFWFVTRGRAKGAAGKFVKWAKGPAGQRVVASNWVPIR